MLSKEQNEQLNRLCRLSFESLVGQMIIDKDATILYFSKEHTKYSGIPNEEAVGKNVRDVLPNTRMDIVLQTGIPEIGSIFEMKHRKTGEVKYMVCNRIPISDKNGEIIGVMSETVFSRGIKDIYRLSDELQKHSHLESFTNDTEHIEELGPAHIDPNKSSGSGADELNMICGSSKAITELKQLIIKVADMPLPVLIQGETGTGKEVFADALHKYSNSRREKNFVKINCAAIPSELLESELFGYEKGSFSGAAKTGKMGKFEYAGDGVVLLDEIGDMPIDLQAKLLRVLQEKEFERVGGLKPIPFHARIICTTNRDLDELISSGKFREDLYYRINVLEMQIPPLRDRLEDISDLSSYFISKINEAYDLSIMGISPRADAFLKSYSWPGNVRELRHVIERSCMMKGSGILDLDDFNFLNKKSENDKPDHSSPKIISFDLREVRIEAEKTAIINALKVTNNNRSKAAELLGIDRSVLYDKLRKYQIEHM